MSHLVRPTSMQTTVFVRDARWQAAIAAMDVANHRHGRGTVLRASLLGHPRVLRKVAAAFSSTAHLHHAVDAAKDRGEMRRDDAADGD